MTTKADAESTLEKRRVKDRTTEPQNRKSDSKAEEAEDDGLVNSNSFETIERVAAVVGELLQQMIVRAVARARDGLRGKLCLLSGASVVFGERESKNVLEEMSE